MTDISERPSVAAIQQEQAPHLQMGYESYIICTSPRSGSTLLCQLMTNTNVAGVPNSYFHKPSLANWMEVHGIAPNSLGNRSETLEAVLKKAHKTGTAETGMFGLRLQGGSLNYFLDQLKLLHPEQNSDVERLNTTFGETAFIFLSRKNKLEQAISCVKAMQTGLWHTAENGTEFERLAPPQPPYFDAKAIRQHIAEFEEDDQRWEHWFTKESIQPLRLSYEDLAKDSVATLNTVLKALGLQTSSTIGTKAPLRKMDNELNEEWATLYRTIPNQI